MFLHSAEQYSPDDNRFDLRPFLTPVSHSWWPFQKMELSVERWEDEARKEKEEEKEKEGKDEVEKEAENQNQINGSVE